GPELDVARAERPRGLLDQLLRLRSGARPGLGWAETEPGPAASARNRRRPGKGGDHRRDVLEPPREQAERIQRWGERMDALQRQQPVGRLVPDDPAVRSGADDGTRGLRAE